MYGVHKVKLYILDAAQSANSMSDCSFSSWYVWLVLNSNNAT